MCLRTPPAPRSPLRSTHRPHSCQACQRLLSLSAGRWLPGWPSFPLGRVGPPLAASSPRLCSFLTPLRDRTGAPAVRAGTGGRVTAWPHAPVQGMAWFNSVNAPGRLWGSLYQSPLSQGRQTRGPSRQRTAPGLSGEGDLTQTQHQGLALGHGSHCPVLTPRRERVSPKHLLLARAPWLCRRGSRPACNLGRPSPLWACFLLGKLS